MFKGAFYILEIMEKLSTIEGRKKLQKMVYLLESSENEIPFKYSYHHYGPYSAQLQEEVDFLVGQFFLQEIRQNGKYIYKITDRGREFKKELEGINDISLSDELLYRLNSKNSQFLEVVSTYAFLIEAGYEKSNAREKTLELKPHLGTTIDEAIDFFENNCN